MSWPYLLNRAQNGKFQAIWHWSLDPHCACCGGPGGFKIVNEDGGPILVQDGGELAQGELFTDESKYRLTAMGPILISRISSTCDTDPNGSYPPCK